MDTLTKSIIEQIVQLNYNMSQFQLGAIAAHKL